MAKVFVLNMKEGPSPGEQTQLQRRSFVLGRDPSCDLVINDVEVSRRHARLIAQSGGYAIEDLGSTNGTFVNDQRIRSVVPLQPDATIRLGGLVTFAYEVTPADLLETSGLSRGATPPSTSQLRAAVPLRAAKVESLPQEKIEMPPQEELTPPLVEPELAPASRRRRPRRGGIRLPIFSRRWMIGCSVIVLLGICAGVAFFWYVDANFLWCDVFGTLIPTCG